MSKKLPAIHPGEILNSQQQYDIHCAQDSLGKALAAIRPWHDASAAA